MNTHQSIERIEGCDMISWQSSSYTSHYSDNYSMNGELVNIENIPMLTSSYSPGSSITNSSNVLEHFDHSTYKTKHRHYKIFQKRFNKCVLSIEHMSAVSKIKLKYIS